MMSLRFDKMMIPIVLSCLVLSCYMCSPSLGDDNINYKCFHKEREALLQFKHGITDDYCDLLTSWEHGTDCCQWRGVRCSNQTGHVIMLHLGEKCLDGKVNPSLGELKHLRHLNLSSNFFRQHVPKFLGSLINLEYLNLSNSDFDGEIPHQLGNLSKLVTLDLSGNLLHGKSLHWLSHLRLLKYLDLGGADLSKPVNWMQIVSNLPFLSVFSMDDCQLYPKIPSSLAYINSSATLHFISLSGNEFADSSVLQWLFSFPGIKTQLVYLDLSNNLLEVPIPDDFRYMKRLSHLSLSRNYLKKPVSNKLWDIPSLTYLSVSGNNLGESVFRICSKLCNLQQLYLAGNNITDELANVIETVVGCSNKVLVTLDLSNNRLSGSIPETISSFSSLRELYLQENRLNGDISQGIGQLSQLERLDFSSNSLKGSLTSEHFLNLANLQEFSSFDNSKLVVNISGDWSPPFQLEILDLGSCNLSLGFPKWLQTQTNISFLDISNADISDIVPASFWSSLSPNLEHLNMSFNQIYGVIPNFSVIFIGVRELDLSSNLFDGAVPSGFTNVYSLYLNDNRFSDSSDILCPETTSVLSELDLSTNLFSGELPDCWMNLDLSSLHLENNKFNGSIPKSFGSMNRLEYLQLDNNSFSGSLPRSLENFTSLVILNLGDNSFTGHIPSWVGNAFPKLGVLSLRKNKFLGELSSSLCRLSHLQILDLSVNNISGRIPKCIHNFTSMENRTDTSTLEYLDAISSDINHDPIIIEHETTIVTWKRVEQKFKNSIELVKSIDLSNNKLHGEIPNGISRLTGLVSLDLSGNNLSGSIPSAIGNLTYLELLDLSSNHLIGEIPVSLAKVSTLAILDVSNNNLSGEIPVSTQLQSFNASSYMGNPGLCGAPLPRCPSNQTVLNELTQDNAAAQDEHDDNGVFPGLYISVVLGFIIGFWGVFGTRVMKMN